MPALVAWFQVRADQAVGEVRRLAPSVYGAVEGTAGLVKQVSTAADDDDDDDDPETDEKKETQAEQEVKNFMSQMGRSVLVAGEALTAARMDSQSDPARKATATRQGASPARVVPDLAGVDTREEQHSV